LNGSARYRIRNELDGHSEHIAIESELRPSYPVPSRKGLEPANWQKRLVPVHRMDP
jgi:hypothetical protein